MVAFTPFDIVKPQTTDGSCTIIWKQTSVPDGIAGGLIRFHDGLALVSGSGGRPARRHICAQPKTQCSCASWSASTTSASASPVLATGPVDLTTSPK